MAKLNSFRDVMEDRFFKKNSDALSIFVEDNPIKLDSNSHCVESPDEATLADVGVRLVDVTDSEGNDILFDFAVSAEIEVSEAVKLRNCNVIIEISICFKSILISAYVTKHKFCSSIFIKIILGGYQIE